MNFGGIYIVEGCVYLLVCAVISVCWLKIFYILWVFHLRGNYRLRFKIAQNNWIAGQGQNPEELYDKPQRSLYSSRFLFTALVLSLTLNISVYVRQRATWMGDDNSYYQAKEYWVAGQVVYAHRMLMGKLLHPDNFLLKPYTSLQKHIYSRGERLLPENDGERHVWKNFWFLYPYSRKGVRPYFVSDKKFSPKMAALLDQYWEAIEGMATLSITDSQMQRKHLLEYPFPVSYYSLYQGHYDGPFSMSGFRTRTSPIYSGRNKKMLQWVDELYKKWEDTGLLQEIQKKYLYVNSFRQNVTMRLLKNLSLPLAYNGEFFCEHPIITRMYLEYQKAMSDDPNENAFLNLKKKKS